MRTYKQTHSWLDFSLDLRKLKYTDWILLGKAVSKIEHISGAPLQPEVARTLHELYLAKGVLGTTAIEGNTLTEEQVLQLLDKKLELPPSKEYLAKEIDNIVEACSHIAEEILEGQSTSITVEEIKRLNYMVLKDLPLTDDNVTPGELRKHTVGAGRYRAVPAEDCSHLLELLCEWLNNDELKDEKANTLSFSILKAIAAHIYFELIHPFGDGNGRTGRLIEFKILLGADVPTPAAHLLSNHYNHTRPAYYKHLDHISMSRGDIYPFISYAIEGLTEGLTEQAERVRDQHREIAWRNYVYETFREKKSEPDKRRRDLLLDLSISNISFSRHSQKFEHNAPYIHIMSIPKITPRLAKAYANKSRMTLSRDIDTLVDIGLLEKTGRMVRPKKELILAFLPKRKK
jgi:Fic family protein